MDVLRTPDDRFEGLQDYPFEPRYVEVEGLRIHYLDEGPDEAAPVLLLHGEPTWSYLYRKMVPVIASAGHRVVAIDFVGFGRSDKPVDPEAYTYQAHVDWTRQAVESIGLRNITLFGQDWGGLIGLRLAAEDPDRFARIVAANTFLPTGDIAPPPVWFMFRDMVAKAPVFDVARTIEAGTVGDLSPAVRAGYEAPFPDERSKTGARRFPAIVPTTADDPSSEPNRAAWKALESWTKPFLTLFGDSDPIMRGAHVPFQQRVPGAAGQPHRLIEGAGHFLQEDAGEEVARAIVDWLAP